jgi:phosphatidylglycerol---prolipoprotein diacylglyceryl transferase
LHPNLIEFGKFALPSYGVLVATGMIVGLIVNVNLAKREGLGEDFAWNLGLISIFSGIVGSKILYAFVEPGYSLRHPASLLTKDFMQAGGIWYGGLIAAVTGGLAYVAYKKMPLLDSLDAFVPGIALGHGIGRLGCFAAGCCYGRETHVPWAVTFKNPLANQLVGTPLNIALHPTQLYEFTTEVALFFLLLWVWRHKRFSGQVFGTYAFLYGIARFVLEFYRDDPGRGSVFGGVMSLTQLISIFMVILGGVMWIRRPAPELARSSLESN